jgi:hypothetical protein
MPPARIPPPLNPPPRIPPPPPPRRASAVSSAITDAQAIAMAKDPMSLNDRIGVLRAPDEKKGADVRD